MAIKILAIFVLIFGIHQSKIINKSFTVKAVPDSVWVLKFDKTGSYEYYNWNGWGGTQVLAKGKYNFDGSLISFKTTKGDSILNSEIPNELYFTKLSKREFENLEGTVFAIKEEKFLFKKKYFILSKSKLEID